MKKFSLLFFSLTLSSISFAYELKGSWHHPAAKPDEKPVVFIKIDGLYRAYVKEEIINRNGTPSHTIEQSLRIFPGEGSMLAGELDVYDSRGCSFKNNDVKVEFEDENKVNFLMNLPRYKIITISTRPSNGHSRIECELLDTIEVPVQLIRAQ